MVISFDSNSPSRHGNSRSPLLDDYLDRWAACSPAADGLRITEDPLAVPAPRQFTEPPATLSLAQDLCELLSTLVAVETGSTTSDTFIADLQIFNERVAVAFPRT